MQMDFSRLIPPYSLLKEKGVGKFSIGKYINTTSLCEGQKDGKEADSKGTTGWLTSLNLHASLLPLLTSFYFITRNCSCVSRREGSILRIS